MLFFKGGGSKVNYTGEKEHFYYDICTKFWNSRYFEYSYIHSYYWVFEIISSGQEMTQSSHGSRNFSKRGGLRRKILKEKWEKCLLIHLSTRVHIKTRQTCNYFSLFLFKRIASYFLLCFITLFYFWNLKGRVATAVTTPLDPLLQSI